MLVEEVDVEIALIVGETGEKLEWNRTWDEYDGIAAERRECVYRKNVMIGVSNDFSFID